MHTERAWQDSISDRDDLAIKEDISMKLCLI